MKNETSRLERLTASDRFLLLWDDSGWAADIGALGVLDGHGLLDSDGRVRIEAVRRWLEPRLEGVPHVRQLLYRPRWWLGGPLWIDAPSLDLADHVRVHPVGPPGDQSRLLQACAELASRRLDPARPLWEVWLLPGLPQERVGLFLRMHHIMADGIAAVAAFGSLLDTAADAPNPVAPSWAPTPMPTAGELLRDNLRRHARRLARLPVGLAHASDLLRRTRRAWPAWRELLAEQRAPRTSLNRPVGADRRLGVLRSRLEATSQIAHAHDAKVNDVVLDVVAGGLRELLSGRGEHLDGLALRAMVPVSLHREQRGQEGASNLDGWMVVPLPLGESDAVRRLDLIKAETTARKRNAHPQTGSGISQSMLFQRAFLHGFAHQRFINISVTNVPGPPVPLYLSGAQLLELFPVVSLMGNIALAVAVFSYNGQLNLTAIADQNVCPDVDVFIHGARIALDDLARSVSEYGV
ncbi:WS/DGAT/MGAT family acyltransferase [Arthrobacter sp. SLBN-100]|uniref:wax ester/triacylglycerol synthase family O-acyltransferase n=1 Tax=Arthrobacter sp. SLBN-100 TaxID=2768450 RepID=UPI001168A887|nr:wax ester/triacylglycerol synthase family O-acyltransferase [Arthrobacter sp. SLBN-100]TQJ66328.1 WS/DGAT/MGAT family acyltransferase [Arthrobacter sp. SLBN-100]